MFAKAPGEVFQVGFLNCTDCFAIISCAAGMMNSASRNAKVESGFIVEVTHCVGSDGQITRNFRIIFHHEFDVISNSILVSSLYRSIASKAEMAPVQISLKLPVRALF